MQEHTFKIIYLCYLYEFYAYSIYIWKCYISWFKFISGKLCLNWESLTWFAILQNKLKRWNLFEEKNEVSGMKLRSSVQAQYIFHQAMMFRIWIYLKSKPVEILKMNVRWYIFVLKSPISAELEIMRLQAALPLLSLPTLIPKYAIIAFAMSDHMMYEP